jgi:glucosamine--fructose-6-phosphate aminotransferase (isomerizing)
MMRIIRRWMARLGITGLYVGRSVPHCPSGSLVVFPYDPQTVSCGITALVAFKRTAPRDGSFQTLHRTLDDIAAWTWDKLKAQELDPVTHYLGGPALLERMRALGARLKEPAPFYEVYADRACQQQLSALAQRLAELVQAEERIRLEQTGREAPPIGDVMAARLTALRDMLWSLEHDLLQTIDQVTRLGRLDQEACPRAGAGRLQELNLILNNLDRLEVRGRDSAGLSLLAVIQESHYTSFMATLEHASLLEEFEARTTGAVLDHRSITVNRTSAGVSMALTYKVAAEVGSLGDNGVYLRGQIRDDAIFQHVVRLPLRHHTVVAHTRWPSVGEISVPNCHPVDGDDH